MTTRILLSLITTLALFATCLEGRYHLEATGLRHHRHDKHRQVWDQDLVPRGSRRREWEETDDEEVSMDRQLREKSVGSSGRRNSDRNFGLDHDRRGSGGAGHRGRYDTQRRGRDRSEGRHPRRDHYRHGNSAASWRHSSDEGAKGRRESNRHTSSSSGRGERPWTYHNPARYDRRRDDDDDVDGYGKVEERRRGRYDDDDEGYEADDEEYYPPRKASSNHEGHSKGRKNRHESNTWREDWRHGVDDDDEDDEDVDDYEEDYEYYDVEETEKRPSRRRHGKRGGNSEDFGIEEKREGPGHSAQNEVPGRRGGRRKDRLPGGERETREKPEDFNEVEEDDGDEDVWGDAETDAEDGSLDEYDETETSDFDFDDSKKESSLKTIDDIIRRLTAGDHTTTTTPKSTPRREYRNIETDNYPPRDRYGNSYEGKPPAKHTVQPHRAVHKKSENGWRTTTPSTITPWSTTRAPKSYARYTTELNRTTNSSRNDVATLINKNVPRADVRKPLVSQLTRTDPDAKTKSLEQDYEEYENDGSDDKPEDIDDVDAETENDKKWPSEKDQDYNEEDNDEDAEGLSSNTTLPPPPTTTLRTTTPTTTTTTTTTTTSPPPLSTRAFDNRRSKILDTRTRVNSYRNSQTTSTEYPAMSDYSAYKWRTIGNRKGVNERRNSAGKDFNDMEIRKAILHAQQMKRETMCRLPRPRVISVREVHMTPSKTYNPSCTILHRCADDTGCCSPEDTCVPKHSHTVELSFYAAGIDGTPSIEKLKFVNHTECQCRRRTPPPPPPPPPTTTMKPCKCTSLFTPRMTPEHGCRCECQDNQPRCIRYRRGKDHFTRTDQWCIKTGQCTIPHCEFGEYMRMPGRCPLKSSKFANQVNDQSSSNVRYRN